MGTGTGIWAIEFADQFPSAAVLGNDLSPIQPSWVPPNCRFIVDNLESEWLYKPGEKFDFIHGRAICGSIKDWPRLYSQVFEHLKPGAWVEMQEYEGVLYSDDDPEFLKAPTIAEWQKKVDERRLASG
jgi:trans-aconitate methyltransferase